ncbi:hypothetical protein CBL_09613 [Carabus blaptoides fortunei]
MKRVMAGVAADGDEKIRISHWLVYCPDRGMAECTVQTDIKTPLNYSSLHRDNAPSPLCRFFRQPFPARIHVFTARRSLIIATTPASDVRTRNCHKTDASRSICNHCRGDRWQHGRSARVKKCYKYEMRAWSGHMCDNWIVPTDHAW